MLIRSAASEGPGGFKPAELVGPSAAAAPLRGSSAPRPDSETGSRPRTVNSTQSAGNTGSDDGEKKKKTFLTLLDYKNLQSSLVQ